MPDLWRISPEILSVEPTSLVDLEILPASDISKSELASLEKELSSLSNAEVPNARCDSWLCTVRGIQSGWAPLLSTDWRILHIQIQSIASVHNSDARNISGINEAFQMSSSTLDGTGEVIAISDTGLDEDHGDFDGRIRSVYSQFGPDNDNSDSLNGHGHMLLPHFWGWLRRPLTSEWHPGRRSICTHISHRVVSSAYTVRYTVFLHIRGIKTLGSTRIVGGHQI